jgi:monothiol glutaredoxin
MEEDIKKKIDDIILGNKVVLFMKGTAESPLCGFSAVVVQILKSLGVNFLDINVLLDPTMRQGIKDYTGWPTIPQLYITGDFVGGCDIVKEMHANGELQNLLKEKNVL